MEPLTLISFLFFTALVGGITWYRTREDDHGTSDGYFLAGRKLGGVVIAGSLLLTNLSTEQLVGLNGAAFGDGMAVMCWEVISGMVLVLMALYFLPRYLRGGIATIPEFLEHRYDHTTRTMTSAIFIIAYAVILLPIIHFHHITRFIITLAIEIDSVHHLFIPGNQTSNVFNLLHQEAGQLLKLPGCKLATEYQHVSSKGKEGDRIKDFPDL